MNTLLGKICIIYRTCLLVLAIYNRMYSIMKVLTLLACDLTQFMASSADSFITSPSCPVIVTFPSPSICVASTNRISPPMGVQANPTATPGCPSLWDTSLSYAGGFKVNIINLSQFLCLYRCIGTCTCNANSWYLPCEIKKSCCRLA
mgnify:CR=1 FL=1